MKRFIAAIMMTVMLFALAGCSDDGPVGYWIIDEVHAGEVVMTQTDAESVGMAKIGAVKLQKSGNCVVELLGDEFEGTWTQAEDGALTVNYGDGDVLEGSIGEDEIMTLTDPQGTEYKLSK